MQRCYIFITVIRRIFVLIFWHNFAPGRAFFQDLVCFVWENRLDTPCLNSKAIVGINAKKTSRNDLLQNFNAIVPIMDKHVNWFWVSCFPGILYGRLSIYGVGLCHLLASYERYILICRPTEKDTVLSNRNRVKMYAIVTTTIAASCLGCLTWSKDMSL